MEKLAIELFRINAIKFGDFKTKVGLYTPVYFDLRVIVSYPSIMESVADILIQKVNLSNNKLICGVPYTALPIATAVSLKTKIPMVMRRKEAKSYGTKKLIEGVFIDGDTCLIIEDVVTSGSSILETVQDLRNSEITCMEAVVLLDREQGGKIFLAENGIKMLSILTMTELMEILYKNKLITEEIKTKVDNYIAANKVKPEAVTVSLKEDRLKLSFLNRIKYTKNKVAADLFSLMMKKETNLCVAADLTEATEILNLAEQVGPFICCFKTHIDIVEDFHPQFIVRLKEIAERCEFILMEDRKFADIGKTVELQYSKGMFEISKWADAVTAHSLFGKGVLDALNKTDSHKNMGVFLLAQASAAGNLIDDKYTEETLSLASDYQNLIAGIVCQSPLFRKYPGLIQLCPGVQLNESKDNLGQQYNSPEDVVILKGGDVAVVGRGVTGASDARNAARKYCELLWAAYKKRISE